MKTALSLISFLFLSNAYAYDCSFPPQSVINSSVKIEVTHEETKGAHIGSGVLLSDRFVLTNLHILESLFKDSTGTNILVRPVFSEKTYKAFLVDFDSVHDIALLRVRDLTYTSEIEILDREVKKNEVIWVAGYRLGRLLHVINGQISKVYSSPYQGTYITDIRIETGYSGSGAFLCHKNKYYLAGLVRAFIADVAGHNLDSSIVITPATIKKFLWKK